MATNRTEQKGSYKEFLKRFKRTKGAGVTVGIHAEDNAPHESGDGATLVEVAIYNEFGTANIPERPFLRTAISEEKKKVAKFISRRIGRAIEGKMPMELALSQIGIKGQSLVRNKITRLKEPPNSPATIDKKGSSNPLIDTGLMRQSIAWKIDE